MRARDVFGVAVRAIAVWLLTQAAYWGFYVVWKLNGGPANPRIPVGEDVAEFVVHLVIGVALLIFADHVVRLAYGPQAKTIIEDTPHGA